MLITGEAMHVGGGVYIIFKKMRDLCDQTDLSLNFIIKQHDKLGQTTEPLKTSVPSVK